MNSKKLWKNYQKLKQQGLNIRFKTYENYVRDIEKYNKKIYYYRKKGYTVNRLVKYPKINVKKSDINFFFKKRQQKLRKRLRRGFIMSEQNIYLQRHIKLLIKSKVSNETIELIKNLTPNLYKRYDEKLYELTMTRFYDTKGELIQYVNNFEDAVISAYEYAIS